MAHPGFIDEKVTAMPVALIGMTQAGLYQDEKQDVVGFILMGKGQVVKNFIFMQSSTQRLRIQLESAFQFHLGIDIMSCFQFLYGSSRIDLQQV